MKYLLFQYGYRNYLNILVPLTLPTLYEKHLPCLSVHMYETRNNLVAPESDSTEVALK